jgi:hypothetical protein
MKTITNSGFLAKYQLLIALPLIILSLVGFTYDHSNLSSEPGFYYLQNQKSPDTSWFLSGNALSDYKRGIDEQISEHGQKSGFIESTVVNPEGFSTLMQTCNKNEFKGKRVKMTGYIKTQGSTETGAMWIRVDDYDKKITADFDNMGDRPVVASKEWTKCEIVFDVPDSRATIFFGFIMSGTGKIWVDNVSFEIVSTSENKTARFLDTPFPEEYLSRLKDFPNDLPEKQPVNLDFEE